MATPDLRRPDDRPSGRAEAWEARRKRQDRGARFAAVSFFVAILAALGLFVVYIAGGQTQLEGLLLFVAFGAVGVGLGIWVKMIVGPQEIVEDRYPMRSTDEDRDRFESEFEESLGEAVVGGRRRFLLRLLTGAGASLGLALLIPLRSLGPGPERELFRTSWQRGSRVVGLEGAPIRAEDVVADQVVTVFPEGAVGAADSQAVLVGLRPGAYESGSFRAETVEGMVVYSKLCTHAGCPVGLYRARAGELLCPCHQSTFDVNDGARVLSGPAGRALPQLPLGVDDGGFLVALGDFTEPVGPSFWNMTHDQGDDA
jgi:ubiquinol-cytochrome c reductase iron-sulfur subunit